MPHESTLIPTREILAHWFVGEGVELGVAAGVFSQAILDAGKCNKLWSIDRWSDHHNLREYRLAAMRLAWAGQGRCIPLRMSFAEAAPLFADRTLDFVYIDGYAHTGQEAGQTLEQWWPKLKPGGLFAGHDYHGRWPATVAAVNDFVTRHGLTLRVTHECPPAGFPSWYCSKP